MATPQLPIRLRPGQVSIYGQPSINGILINNGYQFGVINQLPDNCESAFALDQSVLFCLPENCPNPQLNYYSYFIVPEDKIIFTETPAP